MLTAIQASHVEHVYPEFREAITDFLSRGVAVFVDHQNECGPDVPPFAIRVAERPEFWIDCAHSPRAATQLAKILGLKVIESKSM